MKTTDVPGGFVVSSTLFLTMTLTSVEPGKGFICIHGLSIVPLIFAQKVFIILSASNKKLVLPVSGIRTVTSKEISKFN